MSTYNPIASVTLSSLQTFVTFNNIPQTYTDLVLVINGFLGNNDGTVPRFRLNNDSGNNYSLTALTGTGSTAKSSRYINQSFLYIGSNDIGWSTTSGNRSTNILNIMNYSSSNTFKATLCNTSQPAGSYPGCELEVGTWRNTAPVTSLTVYAGTPGGAIDFASTTTFNLYGIANASIDNVAKATGGDSVYTDGTYWYHIFRSSGTFTPTQALTADYLVVAGGGGGGSRIAGGGGAGGLRCTVTATGGGGSLESALSLTTQAYTVTVGAGGAGGVSMNSGNGQIGTQGSNSVFSSITSTGGGGGGAYNGLNATNGGSGGGNGSPDGGSTRGLGTANQGYNGGASITNQEGGGGGGAGAVGGAGSSSNGGTGGAGVATSISGTSTTYAGGGGGAATGTAGSGGSGGGGAGANGTNNATSGTANTGSGGGGARNTTDTTNVSGGAGGSGIVIVRYSV